MRACISVCVLCRRTLTRAAGGRGTGGVCSLSVLLRFCQRGRRSRRLYCSCPDDPGVDLYSDSLVEMADRQETWRQHRDSHPRGLKGSGWHWEMRLTTLVSGFVAWWWKLVASCLVKVRKREGLPKKPEPQYISTLITVYIMTSGHNRCLC